MYMQRSYFSMSHSALAVALCPNALAASASIARAVKTPGTIAGSSDRDEFRGGP
jgi:hypothetical protein